MVNKLKHLIFHKVTKSCLHLKHRVEVNWARAKINNDIQYFIWGKKTKQLISQYALSPDDGINSVQVSRSVVSNSLWSHQPQHTRPPCPSPASGVYSDPCPLSRWCHPTISSSVVPFASCPQALPASESFPMSQFFTSGGQSIGASASVLPMNIQDWFPSGLTGLTSLQSKGVSGVFSNTTVQTVDFNELFTEAIYGWQMSTWKDAQNQAQRTRRWQRQEA